MALVARILGVALLTSALVLGFGLALIKPERQSPDIVVILFVACVAGVIGAVAGAAREIVSSQRQAGSNRTDIK